MNNIPPEQKGVGIFEFSNVGKLLILAWGLGCVPIGSGLAIYGARAFKSSEHPIVNIIDILMGTGLVFAPVILGILSLTREKITTAPIDPQLPQQR